MTSACGVVEEVNTDESALYEGRVDRKVRAAIKGQTAITVEFVNGANRAFVEDIEKALNLYGRHTYLYAPQANEDVSTVVKHLHRAGIVVLLLLDENQKNNIKTTDVNYITDWDKEGTEVEQVAASPTLLFFKERKEVERIRGLVKRPAIEEVIEKVF